MHFIENICVFMRLTEKRLLEKPDRLFTSISILIKKDVITENFFMNNASV